MEVYLNILGRELMFVDNVAMVGGVRIGRRLICPDGTSCGRLGRLHNNVPGGNKVGIRLIEPAPL
jgi:hypothetical protein